MIAVSTIITSASPCVTSRITSVFEVFRKEVDELLLVHLVREELIFLQSNKHVRIEQNSWSTSMCSLLVGAVFGGGTIVIAVKYNSGSRISTPHVLDLQQTNGVIRHSTRPYYSM